MVDGSQSSQPRRRRGKRTPNACLPCRRSKIKCNGEDPCASCERRLIRCRFNDGGHKVLVSETYLEELRKQAEGHQQSPRSSERQERLDDSSSPVVQEEVTVAREADRRHSTIEVQTLPTPNTYDLESPSGRRSQINDRSPLGTEHLDDDAFGFNITMDDSAGPNTCNSVLDAVVGSPQNGFHSVGSEISTVSPEQNPDSSLSIWPRMSSRTIKNTRRNRRKWIWLAPWSTWSFTMRLMLILGEKLKPSAPPIPSHLWENDIYDLPSTSMPINGPDTRYLPSLDHALYLFNTVKFHLGQTYRFFEEAEFESQIREFYSGHVAQKAAESRLWFVKFLLVLAFGTAFHSRPAHAGSRDPPGSKFFMQAMSLIPDNLQLWRDSLMATEILAMIGLYLFSIDERESGHVYLGQAIHIAEMEGLHTQLPEEEIGTETVTWCRDLWWTLYIMDRHFSASVGLPMSVHDSEITTTIHPPSSGSHTESIRSLQVKLSHLLSMILRTVYKPTKTSLATYIEQTRSTLHTLGEYAQELENILSLKFQTSVDTMPKGMRHITLLYHQCVIVATRPLLLSILKERVDMMGQDVDVNWESVLSHTAAIISTGIKSATKTLQILSSEYSLLEVFLPYDLEFTFGAALHLTMANAIFPDAADDQAYGELAHGILTEMGLRGNRVAEVRKAELMHVEMLFQQLDAQIKQQGYQTLRFPRYQTAGAEPDGREAEERQRLGNIGAEANAAAMITGAVDMYPLVPPSDSGTVDFLDLLDSIGISSEEFFSITQGMGDTEDIPEGVLSMY